MDKGMRAKKQPEILELSLIADDDGGSEEKYFPTREVREFLYCISQSFSVTHACSMAGIKYDSMIHWLSVKSARHKPALLRLFEHAKAMAFTTHIKAINESKDWKAHAFWLERNEKDFAPKDPRNPQVINNIGINSSPDHIQLSPEMLKSLSQAYDDMRKESV